MAKRARPPGLPRDGRHIRPVQDADPGIALSEHTHDGATVLVAVPTLRLAGTEYALAPEHARILGTCLIETALLAEPITGEYLRLREDGLSVADATDQLTARFIAEGNWLAQRTRHHAQEVALAHVRSLVQLANEEIILSGDSKHFGRA